MRMPAPPRGRLVRPQSNQALTHLPQQLGRMVVRRLAEQRRWAPADEVPARHLLGLERVRQVDQRVRPGPGRRPTRRTPNHAIETSPPRTRRVPTTPG